MVVTGKKKTQFRCLTQTSIRDGLGERGAKLLGTLSKGAIVPGPFSTGQAEAYDANLRKGLSVISDCLRMVSDQLPTHWQVGDGPGGYLCTNNGLRALFHVMKDVSDHVRQKTGAELYGMDADETFKAIEPYLQCLMDYFKNASDQEIQSFRRVGSSLTAVRQQAYGMEVQIRKKFPDFKPAGLQEYLDSRDEAGTEEARTKVLRIQKRIFDYVIGVLKKQYGTQDRAWWVKGVPSKIRIDCSARWEAKDQEGEPESQLYLQNYVDICIHNWTLVKDVISLDEKDKEAKTKNTKWIRDLNDIRNKVAHPEQGVLDAEQVALVKEIYGKVEKHFPAETAQAQAVA